MSLGSDIGLATYREPLYAFPEAKKEARPAIKLHGELWGLAFVRVGAEDAPAQTAMGLRGPARTPFDPKMRSFLAAVLFLLRRLSLFLTWTSGYRDEFFALAKPKVKTLSAQCSAVCEQSEVGRVEPTRSAG